MSSSRRKSAGQVAAAVFAVIGAACMFLPDNPNGQVFGAPNGTVCGDAGAGDCCIENGTPGCDDQSCCDIVCAADPFCCAPDGVWDQSCADAAAAACAPGTCPGSCPGEGDCCIEHGSPGCEDEACCAIVCALNPFCCDSNGIWDQACADTAAARCAPGTCPGTCPGQGDCCIEHGSPGCDDAACCATVCAAIPFCCAGSGIWDQGCADAAAALCAPGTCPGACPGQGECCVEHGSPGCDDAACCATVCAADPFCCDSNGIWDQGCADAAAALCAPGTCPGACPGQGDCCVEHGSPGCDDAACCATVCAFNPFCCDSNGIWDQGCADAAAARCAPGTCPGTCPGQGECCVEHGSPGCDDAACCAAVCAADPVCCDSNGIWDQGCADAAETLCAPGTCPGICPGEGDCCTEHGSPGCDDRSCCTSVCASDPFCCDSNGIWDQGCADAAATLCSPGTCPGPCPGEGDCCVEHGSPGCEDASCCATVCAANPFCCDSNGIWDQACADAAQVLCDPGTCPGECPGQGGCCVDNGTPGCEDAACCELVCAADPFCCDTVWDQQCADAGSALCTCDLFGDFDGDGDVDLTDHAALAECLFGPGVAPDPASPIDILDCLNAFDSDDDIDVDLFDAAQFTLAFTG